MRLWDRVEWALEWKVEVQLQILFCFVFFKFLHFQNLRGLVTEKIPVMNPTVEWVIKAHDKFYKLQFEAVLLIAGGTHGPFGVWLQGFVYCSLSCVMGSSTVVHTSWGQAPNFHFLCGTKGDKRDSVKGMVENFKKIYYNKRHISCVPLEILYQVQNTVLWMHLCHRSCTFWNSSRTPTLSL